MSLRYKYKKLLVWLQSKAIKNPPLTEREYLTKKVIIRLLSNPKTHYLMTPSSRYYIQLDMHNQICEPHQIYYLQNISSTV